MTNTRACVRCGQPNDNTDGRVKRCSKCIAYQSTYYRENKEREIARHAEWAERNKKHLAEYMKTRRATTDGPLKVDRARRQKNGERLRASACATYKSKGYAYHYKWKYGLTQDAYNSMKKSQNDRCAICGVTEQADKPHGRFHIDHCHSTGIVRGLLCHSCNHGIGNFKDSTDLLNKAANYLLTKSLGASHLS